MEGENVLVEALEERGFAATCSPMGAGKWRDAYTPWFRGVHVIILPDNDEPGHLHARKVRASLEPVAASVRIVNLPGLPPGGDVVDFFEAGGDPNAIATLDTPATRRPGSSRPMPSGRTNSRKWYCRPRS